MSAPAILSRTKGSARPPKLLPPPTQPMTTSMPCSPGHRELLLRLLADHRLVHQHVVQDGAQRVAGVLAGRGVLDRLGDGDPQAARRVGVGLADLPAGVGVGRRAGDDVGAPRLHHDPAVRLLLVADPHHVDLALQPEHLAGERERRPPLAGSGLGRQALAAGLRAVEGLRHGGVRLVRPGGRDALVLVVDAGAGAQRLLQPAGAVERRRPPHPVDVQHLLRHGDLGIGRDLLEDDVHREQRRQIVGPHGLAGARMERRLRPVRHVGRDVVPVPRDLAFRQLDLGVAHDRPLAVVGEP